LGEKDIAEKILEAYDDVFADIVNVLLFDGEQVVKEEDLEEESEYSHYKADGKLHEQTRDVAKYWKKGDVKIAFYGLENQTDIDIDMPLRVIGYDGAAYRAQFLADTEKIINEGGEEKRIKVRKPRYPVITLVLNFNYKRRWKKPLRLFECLNIPERLKPFVNDYRINVYDIAWLTDKQVSMFQSDFKVVADYFVQMRKTRYYIPSSDVIKHVHEVLQLMAIMTNDNRFEQAYNVNLEKGEVNMCEVLDRVENRGFERGIFAFIRAFLRNGASKNQIIEELIEGFELTSEKAQGYYDECYNAFVQGGATPL